jgi:hypothetical protein
VWLFREVLPYKHWKHILLGSWSEPSLREPASLRQQILRHRGLLLTLPIGNTLYLDPVTGPFECGMLRLVLQSANIEKSALGGCALLPTVHYLRS